MRVGKSLFWLSAASYVTYDIWYEVYKKFWVNLPNFASVYGHGSYAIITGATEGIGKGFAEVLASRGMNLVLVSRSSFKLQTLADELEDKYKIKTLIHAIDLSTAKEKDYKDLKKKTDAVDVSMLINNAGQVSYKKTTDFSFGEIEKLVTLNSVSVIHLLNIYLPHLQSRGYRSAIINLSSLLAVKPMPYLTLYSSTKAFDHYLSIGLSEEYKDSIDILSFQPSTVTTRGTNFDSSWRSETVQNSVTGALKDLGVRKTTHGTIKHQLFASLLQILPESIRLNKGYETLEKIGKSRLDND